MEVVVTGSLGFDYIMDFSGRFSERIMPDKIHQLSLSFLVDKLSKNFGGTAGNIAYSLKLLGIEPLIASCAGNDFSEYEKHLLSHEINTKHIIVKKDVITGSYFVVTDQNDNQIGAFYTGSTSYNNKIRLKPMLNQKVALVIIAPNSPDAMLGYVKECQVTKTPYLFDPAFQIDNFTQIELRHSISGATILIGNDYEIALIEKKMKLTHRALLELVPILITTLGHKGSTIETKKDKLDISVAKPFNTSDPTGAGDAYRAGFIAGFLQGFDLKTCGQMGATAGVYTVEKYGTQTHEFTLNSFCDRYFQNFHSRLQL